jgi:hypothetical protein
MKVKIKLSKRHPNNFMYFGKHIITYQDQTLELSKEEQALLETTGPKHWFAISKIEAPKKEIKNEVKKESKKKTGKKRARK